jgi:hypothetical protein
LASEYSSPFYPKCSGRTVKGFSKDQPVPGELPSIRVTICYLMKHKLDNTITFIRVAELLPTTEVKQY